MLRPCTDTYRVYALAVTPFVRDLSMPGTLTRPRSMARGSLSGTSPAVRALVRLSTFSTRSAVLLAAAVGPFELVAVVCAGVEADATKPAMPAAKAPTARSQHGQAHVYTPVPNAHLVC